MTKSLSPLRYPGGKSKIYDKVKNLIEANSLGNRTYVEPFAGGFGIAIGLLCDDTVQTVVLNDFDSHIFHFWYAVLHHSDELLQKISDTPITLEERDKQKSVYKEHSSACSVIWLCKIGHGTTPLMKCYYLCPEFCPHPQHRNIQTFKTIQKSTFQRQLGDAVLFVVLCKRTLHYFF